MVSFSAIRETLSFIGKSRGGLIFDTLVLALAVFRLYKKYGWLGMRGKIWETIGDGLVVALVAGVLLFAVVFINVPPSINASSNELLVKKQIEEEQIRGAMASCRGSLSIETAKAGLLVSQRDSQQQTIDSQQEQLNSAQGTVNSCVVSLGKLNPSLSTKVKLFFEPMYVESRPGEFRYSEPVKTYWGLFIITTNQRTSPQGIIKCKQGFTPGVPQIADMGMAGVVVSSPPAKISSNEYEIRINDLGADWNSNSPILIRVSTPSQSLNDCSFKTQ